MINIFPVYDITHSKPLRIKSKDDPPRAFVNSLNPSDHFVLLFSQSVKRRLS